MTRSEEAAGTPMDPANVAPLVVFLASDHAAGINGQTFGASGYRITHYAPMQSYKQLVNTGPWDLERLFRLFKPTFGRELKAPTMF